MDPMEASGELVAESVALVTAATGNLDARIPACPDWRVADLVAHLGEVHAFWSELVERRQTTPPDAALHRTPVPSTLMLLEWFLVGAERLAELLATRSSVDPVWTWHPDDQTVGWVRRRMLEETAVHRWDVQAATASPQPIGIQTAAVGIEEFLTVWLPSTANARTAVFDGPHGVVALEPTDVEPSWRVQLGPGGPVVDGGADRADAALRGPASELLLVLWRRRPLRELETTGDPALLTALIEYADLT